MNVDGCLVPGLTPGEVEIIRELVGDEYNAWVFGSRAVGSHRPFSDVDICLEGQGIISDEAMADLREKFRESDLPYKVDVVDLRQISDAFRTHIFRAAICVAHGGWVGGVREV